MKRGVNRNDRRKLETEISITADDPVRIRPKQLIYVPGFVTWLPGTLG